MCCADEKHAVLERPTKGILVNALEYCSITTLIGLLPQLKDLNELGVVVEALNSGLHCVIDVEPSLV